MGNEGESKQVLLSRIRLLQGMSSEKTFPHDKLPSSNFLCVSLVILAEILELVMGKVLVPVDLGYLQVKKKR
ncbi:unnamed protein product [Eruca vesicaria subsp. sativa]|uniref:Uncharacterized protein n=1 Tax=Eruca vesicaria subsp. sativa TaxID=29727 RepID=A0ABC8M7D0_ERUVS|nr:unnamed protein product [Eruca vesicaria subsp. sativa]